MYYYLLIATSHKIELNLNLDVYYLNEDFTLIDDHHLKHQDKIIEFEYLIYSNKLNINYEKENLLLRENTIPITNFYFQTSIENIYFITEDNLEEKINNIINNE